MTADLTVRSWRNRNPLNVTSPTSPSGWWVGQIAMDGMFAVFSSDINGWRAAFTNLVAYKVHHGINTIQGIVARWAPDAAGGNNDATYALLVSKITGFGETQTIDLQDWGTMLNLGTAMAVVEGGYLPWSRPDKLLGLKAAGVSPSHDIGPTNA